MERFGSTVWKQAPKPSCRHCRLPLPSDPPSLAGKAKSSLIDSLYQGVCAYELVMNRAMLCRTFIQVRDRASEKMPNTRSAKKALRKSQKRRLLNRSQRSSLRTTIKKFRTAAAAGDAEAAESAFRLAVKSLDQAAAKNLIHKNTAARTKSRLSKLRPAKSAEQPVAT